jgi:hypothetical protein
MRRRGLLVCASVGILAILAGAFAPLPGATSSREAVSWTEETDPALLATPTTYIFVDATPWASLQTWLASRSRQRVSAVDLRAELLSEGCYVPVSRKVVSQHAAVARLAKHIGEDLALRFSLLHEAGHCELWRRSGGRAGKNEAVARALGRSAQEQSLRIAIIPMIFEEAYADARAAIVFGARLSPVERSRVTAELVAWRTAMPGDESQRALRAVADLRDLPSASSEVHRLALRVAGSVAHGVGEKLGLDRAQIDMIIAPYKGNQEV